jgi:glycosyltransferase involved in cell wall biosynthesis
MNSTDTPARGRAHHSSFIIATRNRARDLLRTVESLVGQTVVPTELCIVDASEDAPSKPAIARLCSEAGIELDYVHPAPSGLPRQRNIGIDRTAGDPVFFIDDDVWLDPHCHEEVLAQYELGGPELGGVRVAPARPEQPIVPMRWFRRFFCLGGWWPEADSRVTRGFFVRGPSVSHEVKRVDCFKGYFMSFRRGVFEHERFDEMLSGYAWKEDFDFTYRVSRRFPLVQTSSARCDHLKSEIQRMSPHHLERMKMANQFYLHGKLFAQTPANRVAFWWALVGLFVYDVIVAVQRRKPGMVTGLVVGVWEQLRGKGLIHPDGSAVRMMPGWDAPGRSAAQRDELGA